MDELAILAKERMSKSIVNLKDQFNTLRTGRANAALLDRVEADYYGDNLPIKDICQISSPEPRQLIVKPYDKGDVKAVYTAIVASDLGLNPTNEGDQIRITIPALTEDKRRELAKKGKAYAEDAKVAIRNIRREFVDMVKCGIIDPTKVTRSALQNAASIAATLLTTESLITDIPKPEAPMPQGGMNGMY